MSESGYRLLPIVILRVRTAPKTITKLSPFEMTYGRSFLTPDMLTDPETQAHLKHIINLGQVQKTIQEYGNRVQPAPVNSLSYPVVKCGDWVLSETWKNEYPGNQLLPKWKGPYQVLQSTLTAVKLQRVISWVHLSRIEPVPSDRLQEPEEPHSSHPCESTTSSKSPQDPEDQNSLNSRWMGGRRPEATIQK